MDYLIIRVALMAQLTSFCIRVRKLRREATGRGIWRAARARKDPSTFTVVFEDSAALAGVFIAALGLFLAERLGHPAFDGVASALIGILLAVVAVVLAHESKELLVGRSADPVVSEDIRKLTESHEHIEKVINMLSMHLGPHELLLNLDLKFRGTFTASQIVFVVEDLDNAIRNRFPDVFRISIEARAFRGQALLAPPASSDLS